MKVPAGAVYTDASGDRVASARGLLAYFTPLLSTLVLVVTGFAAPTLWLVGAAQYIVCIFSRSINATLAMPYLSSSSIR